MTRAGQILALALACGNASFAAFGFGLLIAGQEMWWWLPPVNAVMAWRMWRLAE